MHSSPGLHWTMLTREQTFGLNTLTPLNVTSLGFNCCFSGLFFCFKQLFPLRFDAGKYFIDGKYYKYCQHYRVCYILLLVEPKKLHFSSLCLNYSIILQVKVISLSLLYMLYQRKLAVPNLELFIGLLLSIGSKINCNTLESFFCFVFWGQPFGMWMHFNFISKYKAT